MADFFEEREAVRRAFDDWEDARRNNRTPWERSRALFRLSQALRRCDAAANIERDRIWAEERCESEAPEGRTGPCVQPRGHPGQHSGPVCRQGVPVSAYDCWDPVDESLTDG